MKANTALAALLSAWSLWASRADEREAIRRSVAGLALAATVAALAVEALAEYLPGFPLRLDAWLVPHGGTSNPGRMSPQTATAFLLLGIIMLFGPRLSRLATKAADLLVLCLCLLLLLVLSGYLFGVLRLFGLSMGNRVSLQTLLCLLLLAFAALRRRSRAGFFAILRGAGIGGEMARFTSPIALALPILLEVGRQGMVRRGVSGENFATAMASGLASICAFTLVLALARRIEELEEQLHELSLRDDLTKLYNRKGFFAAAGRAMLAARSSSSPFSVLFIDMDNLKVINDSFGHNAGSDALREMAALLTKSFRKADVIGRIGGDEFVVACECSEREAVDAARRLESSASGSNHKRPHALSFSLGHVTAEVHDNQSLEHMLTQADARMYRVKRRKKENADEELLGLGQSGAQP